PSYSGGAFSGSLPMPAASQPATRPGICSVHSSSTLGAPNEGARPPGGGGVGGASGERPRPLGRSLPGSVLLVSTSGSSPSWAWPTLPVASSAQPRANPSSPRHRVGTRIDDRVDRFPVPWSGPSTRGSSAVEASGS